MHHNWATLDRRLLIKLGTAGLAALALPGTAHAFAAQGFTHGVASGEPSDTSVLLWTRYVAASDTRLMAEISDSADFARVIALSGTDALASHDHTAKVTVGGLSPDRWYYYRFVAPDGTRSVTGRTRTLPVEPTAQFTIGVFSCSNLPFGYFNAYAHACDANAIDLAVHLGDYLYEYPVGDYPSLRQAVPGRMIQPDHEIVALADYRLRYASYRADTDLQRLHQMVPMIAQWDDHEFANDAWTGGAQNHQPEDGDWAARRTAAERAYREWMPVSDDRFRRYDIGTLATLFLPETRISGRDAETDVAAMLAGSTDALATLRGYRDGAWQDAGRHMLGAAQERWLADGFKQSVSAGKRWQVLAQQTIMGTLVSAPEAANWVGPDAPDYIVARVNRAQLQAKAGLPFNLDAWDGYPQARRRVFAAAQAAEANLVVLTGDTHNGWAFDLQQDGAAVGVEFAGPGVSSPGLENSTRGVAEADRVSALRRANPLLRWADTERRGYMTVTLTPDAATSRWHLLDTVRTHSTAMARTVDLRVLPGYRTISNG